MFYNLITRFETNFGQPQVASEHEIGTTPTEWLHSFLILWTNCRVFSVFLSFWVFGFQRMLSRFLVGKFFGLRSSEFLEILTLPFDGLNRVLEHIPMTRSFPKGILEMFSEVLRWRPSWTLLNQKLLKRSQRTAKPSSFLVSLKLRARNSEISFPISSTLSTVHLWKAKAF